MIPPTVSSSFANTLDNIDVAESSGRAGTGGIEVDSAANVEKGVDKAKAEARRRRDRVHDSTGAEAGIWVVVDDGGMAVATGIDVEPSVPIL